MQGNVTGPGGSLNLYDENGFRLVWGEPDWDGTGGFFQVQRNETDLGFSVEGNYNNSEEPRVQILGSSNSVKFDMGNATEDNVVQLPNNAINSVEILDEPGVASDQGNSGTIISSVAMADIRTVTITIPAAGYIYVTGRSYIYTTGSIASNFIYTQIDETSGGSFAAPYRTKSGMHTYPSTGDFYYTPTASRIYFKGAAGTYTFILEGIKSNATTTTRVYDAMVTAMYFPTGYGAVTTFAGSPGSGINAEEVQVIADQDPAVTNTMYKVDLRDLELKVTKEKADLLKAERDLARAQNAQTGQGLK